MSRWTISRASSGQSISCSCFKVSSRGAMTQTSSGRASFSFRIFLVPTASRPTVDSACSSMGRPQLWRWKVMVTTNIVKHEALVHDATLARATEALHSRAAMRALDRPRDRAELELLRPSAALWSPKTSSVNIRSALNSQPGYAATDYPCDDRRSRLDDRPTECPGSPLLWVIPVRGHCSRTRILLIGCS